MTDIIDSSVQNAAPFSNGKNVFRVQKQLCIPREKTQSISFLPQQSNKKRDLFAFNDELEEQVRKKKMHSDSNDKCVELAASALLNLGNSTSFDFEQKMRDVASRVFCGNQSLSYEAINLLISIAKEFFLNTIPIAQHLSYFLRRLLTSNLFNHVIQRYEPHQSHLLTLEEAVDQQLVIIQNAHFWVDICAFALYKYFYSEVIMPHRPFTSIRLQAKWRMEKCLHGMQRSPKTLLCDGKVWRIKKVVRNIVL